MIFKTSSQIINITFVQNFLTSKHFRFQSFKYPHRIQFCFNKTWLENRLIWYLEIRTFFDRPPESLKGICEQNSEYN